MAVDFIGVPIELIHSSTVFYQPAVIDLKRCLAVHGCDTCPKVGRLTCSSVHFGVCVPIRHRLDVLKTIIENSFDCNLTFAYKVHSKNEKGSREISSIPSKDAKISNSSSELKISEKPQSQKVKPDQKKDLSQEASGCVNLSDKLSQRVEGSDLPSKFPSQFSSKAAQPESVTFEATSSVPTQYVKPFYFPMGVPTPQTDAKNLEIAKLIQEEFEKIEGKKASMKNMASLIKVCKLAHYWKVPFFKFLCAGDNTDHVTFQKFLAGWNKLTKNCFDDAAMFLYISCKPGNNYLAFDDFLPLVQDVVDCHPGLTFLQDAPEFHSRYIQTVISRIFYNLNRSWSGQITVQEIRSSNLLKTIERLEIEEDINQILEFFSYEHFYVIYCKFWELDQDHDLLISESDLARHNNYAISSRMINRIFSGAVTRNLTNGKLTYRDFVWFLISEEDKKNPRSIEYWFRCMDLDGDGIISMYEMEYFYEEQVKKMELLDIETLPFQDCLCQMLDMINPVEPGCIRLRDLKLSTLTPIFFDTFFNLEKYLRHEQKDPFSALREGDDSGLSDFEKFAAEEYEMLVAEEGTGDNQSTEIIYDDDFESNDDRRSCDNDTIKRSD